MGYLLVLDKEKENADSGSSDFSVPGLEFVVSN